MFILHLLKSIPYKVLSGFRISLFSLIVNCIFHSRKVIIQRFVKFRNSTLGDYSYIGYSSNINNSQIGMFCSISANVNIGLPTHPTNYISTSPIFFNTYNALKKTWVKVDTYDSSPRRTIIGNDVWIGLNSTILGGVRIGDGAIIAAHSLVTKDVPDYAIVGGIPAKILRYRFSEETIKKLLDLKWWNKTEKDLKKNIKFFSKKVNDNTLFDFEL